MELTTEEDKMLEGRYGLGTQKCMDLLVKLGNIFGADKMVGVSGVHMSTGMPNELLEEMSEGTDRVMTFASLHAAFDSEWFVGKVGTMLTGKTLKELIIRGDSDFSKRLQRLNRLGFLPTFTCAPYSIGIPHAPGNVLCLTGSSGQVISNSIFSSRANRESVASSFAAAITGRTPHIGLIVNGNRYAKLLIQVDDELDVTSFSEADYGALGYYIGNKAGINNVAIKGIPHTVTFEEQRMLLSPLPVSGACVMCHIIGVTPEARTVGEAFGNENPQHITVVGKKQLKEAYDQLINADSDEVDMVALGCPHLTIAELSRLANLLENKAINKNVRLLIGVSFPIYTLARDAGYISVIENAGGVCMNICVAASNRLLFPNDLPKVVATNSARAAHYIQRMTAGKSKTIYGDMKQCVRAAINGKWSI